MSTFSAWLSSFLCRRRTEEHRHPHTVPAMASSHNSCSLYNLDMVRHMLAGTGAACLTAIVTCPLDVVKTRLQNGQMIIRTDTALGEPRNPLAYTLRALQHIRHNEGVRSLYRGLAPTLMGYLPSFAIYFPVYHRSKEEIAIYLDRSIDSPLVHVMSAAFAGGASSLVSNPLWVIRNRLVTQSASTPYHYQGAADAFTKILRNEGIKGFYRGVSLSFFGLLHVAIQFPIYEWLKIVQKSHDQELLHPGQIFIASTISKLVASTVAYPHEVLRTRFQNQTEKTPKYRGILQAIRLIWKEEGRAGLYRGLSTNLIRALPASAVTLISYELLLRYLDDFL